MSEEGISFATQRANAFLRERYLHFVSSLGGAPATIKMYENTNVKCILQSVDVKFENIIVNNLETPVPPQIPSAVLRTNDIISIQLKKVN